MPGRQAPGPGVGTGADRVQPYVLACRSGVCDVAVGAGVHGEWPREPALEGGGDGADMRQGVRLLTLGLLGVWPDAGVGPGCAGMGRSFSPAASTRHRAMIADPTTLDPTDRALAPLWRPALPLLSLPRHRQVPPPLAVAAPPSRQVDAPLTRRFGRLAPTPSPLRAAVLLLLADLYAKDPRSTKLLVWTVVILDIANTAMNAEQIFHYGTDQHRDFYSVAISEAFSRSPPPLLSGPN